MNDIIKILEWDSEFFGYKVASLRLKNHKLNEVGILIKKLKKQDVRLAYFFVSPEDDISNYNIRKLSGLLVDKKITFFIRLNDAEAYPDCKFVKPYPLDYSSDKLKSIALQSGIYSRFKVDPNFKNNEYEKLYTEWIEKSVRREIADEVLVYCEEEDGNEKGLITLGIKGNSGSIGLLAVDEAARGKSIGRKLVQSSFLYFKEERVSYIEVVTQTENKSACGFYESMDFKFKETINIYHLWIS